MQPSHRREDALTREAMPGLDDPDYLALMREWEAADVPTIVRTSTPNLAPPAHPQIGAVLRKLGTVGAIAVAIWGIRHLRGK